jgi:hypothetical protein
VISQDTDQSTARQLAGLLSAQTGMAHIAVTVPLGSWGGHERAWAVQGPCADRADARIAAKREQNH